nr:hypothetical protein CFP56_32294 [Quercus suber]
MKWKPLALEWRYDSSARGSCGGGGGVRGRRARNKMLRDNLLDHHLVSCNSRPFRLLASRNSTATASSSPSSVPQDG